MEKQDTEIGNTMAKYPYRAPMAIVEVLRPYVEGKTYCELGTHDGDIMLEVSKYAKSAVGIEWGPIQYDSCISKDLNVMLGDFNKIDVPKAEVYFIWCDDALESAKPIYSTHPGTWIFGRRPEDVRFKSDQETIIEVPFVEEDIIIGKEVSGIFELLIKDIKI